MAPLVSGSSRAPHAVTGATARVSFKGHIESANRYYYLPVSLAQACIQPLYICSRAFAIVRLRAFCVDRTIYYSAMFGPLR
jgi:hypothetical protein